MFSSPTCSTTLSQLGRPNIHTTAYKKGEKAKIQRNMMVFKLQIISQLHIPLQLTFSLPKISRMSAPSWRENMGIHSNFPKPTSLITQISVHALFLPHTEHITPTLKETGPILLWYTA